MRKIQSQILLAVILMFSALVAGHAEKRAVSFDDFIRIIRISDPQVSPQGDWVAFVATEMNLQKNRGNSDIWIVPLTGGNPWKLTSSTASDTSPRWAPDGKSIAFISSRSGSPQIWTIRLDGGEAKQLTSFPTGASGVVWSPSGERLAFISSVYPECPDIDCLEKKIEQTQRNPVKAEIFDELLFRHWNSWRHGRRSHVIIVNADGSEARDVTPGDYDTPPISLGSSHDVTFSPDGNSVCFVRNIDPNLKMALGTNNDLFITPVSGGTIEPITRNKANDNSPHFSPDGQYIAYRAMARPGFEADKYSLFLYDRDAKTHTNLTKDLDLSIDDLTWSPDGSSLYFTYKEKGRTGLSRLVLGEHRITKVLEGFTISSLQIASDGHSLVFIKQAINKPPDLFTYNMKSKKMAQLTNMNGRLLADLEMNPVEEFWFKGAGKDNVHGFLVKPPFFDPKKKYPLVMLIHGGPQGAWGDEFHFRWNAQMFAAPGYVVAMINFHGSTGYGQKFTDSISGDWGGKPYEDIMRSLDFLLARYDFINKKKIGAAGASYGGYMINWIEGHTERFNCLISHAGVYDLRSMHGATEELWFPEWDLRGTPWTNEKMYARFSPSFYVRSFKTPCLVIHGQLDFRVPVTQGFQFFTALQRMKVPSRLLYFPDEGHFVRKPRNAELWWKTMHAWLAQYLF